MNKEMKKYFAIKGSVLLMIIASVVTGMSSCDRDGWEKSIGPVGTCFPIYIYVEGIGGKDLCYDLLDVSKWYPTNAPKEQANGADFSSDVYDMFVKFASEENKIKGYQRAYEEQITMELAENGKWFLRSEYLATGVFEQETITYEWRFPALFGDNEVHRIIAKWKIKTGKNKDNSYYSTCESFEFDGTKYDVKQIEHPVYSGGIANVVTIHLDR